MHRAAGRRADLEGHRLALGEGEHTILTEPPRELGTPATGAVLARRDQGDGPSAGRDECGPSKRPRAGGRVHDGDRLAPFEPGGELAVGGAALGQIEKSPQPGARHRCRASH